MRDIQDKTDGTGDILSAEAFNVNLINELQDIVSNAGFTLDPEAGPDTDTSMFSKSLVIHSTASQYYQESGVADAYVLSRSGTIEALPSYIDGMIVFFNPGNDNTGPSTINIDAIGVKDLVAADGTALTGGEVVADVYCAVRYNSSSDDFELVKSAGDDAATLGGHPASYFAVDSLAAHLAGTETFTAKKTFSAGIEMSGSASNIQLGANYLSYDGTDAGLTLNSNNYVGIGIDNPAEMLQVQVATGSVAIRLGIANANDWLVRNNSGTMEITRPSGSARISIVDSGDVTVLGTLSAATVTPADGASGTIDTTATQTITVVNGIITSIV